MDEKAKILDIAMNLNRIGNWAADDYEAKRERIELFLGNTTDYINSLPKDKLSKKFRKTYEAFLEEFVELKKAGQQGVKDPLKWAEDMMTWGNILTHRSKLI